MTNENIYLHFDHVKLIRFHQISQVVLGDVLTYMISFRIKISITSVSRFSYWNWVSYLTSPVGMADYDDKQIRRSDFMHVIYLSPRQTINAKHHNT
jgi:hypothetical protein